MLVPRAPHRWKVTPRQAAAIQMRLASRVRVEPIDPASRFVAGMDLAFTPDGAVCIAAAVLWDMRVGVAIEQVTATRPVTFPYVPGLLSFREAPALLAALRKLRGAVDVLMCDGHGLAHPRRFGLACHIGVLADRPTIGCAKRRLTGIARVPGAKRGAATALREGAEQLGLLLRTRDGVKPVYISVGHRADLSSAKRIALQCATGYRLPEPTRLADRLVARVKREYRP